MNTGADAMNRTLHTDFTEATENAQERANQNGAPVGIWRGPLTGAFIVDEDPESELEMSGFEMWAVVEPSVGGEAGVA